MNKLLLFFIIIFCFGCVSDRNIVSVRQVESDSYVVLRMRNDRAHIHSILYPVSFEFRKNVKKNLFYCENSYFAKNDELCPGTAGCYLKPYDGDENLKSSYKKFCGTIKYVVDKDDTLKNIMSEYYRVVLEEKKDTIHIPLEIFKEKHGELIREYLDGDSIYLHFHDHKRFYDIPLKMEFLEFEGMGK